MQVELTPDEVELLVRAADVLSAEADSRGYGPVTERAEGLAGKLREQEWERRPGAPPAAS